jgi:hypothetical protein
MSEPKEFPNLAAFTEAVSAMQATSAEALEGATKLAETIKASQFPKVDLTPHLAAMTTAALGHVAAQEMTNQMEAERAYARLAMSVPPDRQEVALAEVARRRDLFTSTWSESARTGDRPDVAALKSVVDDVVNGRWLL